MAQDWITEFFDKDFAETYLDRSGEDAINIAGFLIRQLGLQPGNIVFDQCCGTGAVSHALAQKGMRVIGVDIVPDYIAQAKETAQRQGLDCVFDCADAATYRPDQQVDAAFNWWTSFGYAENDAENMKLLRQVFMSLRPGGMFILEHVNKTYCLARLDPEGCAVSETPTGLWTSFYDADKEMLYRSWTPRHGTEKQGGGIRLYDPDVLKALLRKAGFDDVVISCNDHNPRMMAIARKPGLFRTELPATAAETREAVYKGALYKLAATPQTLALANVVREKIAELFRDMPLRHVHQHLAFPDIAARLAPLRRALAEDSMFHNALLSVLSAYGFDLSETAFDPLRLRCILHEGHVNAGAAAAYAIHRDTWYGNPQAQINGWIALHDIAADESFAFYPEYFAKPVDNASALFNYNDMLASAGWQKTKAGGYPHYPAAPENLVARRTGFDIKAGEIVLFSAAHLHGTCKIATGLSRWSLDFRTVHLDDHAKGRGAVNVDNHSPPLAAESYLRARDIT